MGSGHCGREEPLPPELQHRRNWDEKSAGLGFLLRHSLGDRRTRDAVPFDGHENYNILIGCLDNPRAWRVKQKLCRGDHPSPFWLDCGNATDNSQVLLGNTLHRPGLAFQVGGVCVALPIPPCSIRSCYCLNPSRQPTPFWKNLFYKDAGWY